MDNSFLYSFEMKQEIKFAIIKFKALFWLFSFNNDKFAIEFDLNSYSYQITVQWSYQGEKDGRTMWHVRGSMKMRTRFG
jgi:hypothetical protein